MSTYKKKPFNKKSYQSTNKNIGNDDDFIDENEIESSTIITNSKKSLVIVESPGKIKKIKSYLGSDYIVMASVGHIMDLPPKELGINLESLEPSYIINVDKKNVVTGLKNVLKNVSQVYIASDADREGEFIGYSLVKLLGLKDNYNRIVFHEITKSAINKAISKPTKLDQHMIYAQQCRRIIDRLIGFLISPILSKSVKGGWGAGRVQSVIVKLILDKQEERDKFWLKNDSTYFICNGSFDINVPNLCSQKFKLNGKMYIDNFLIKTNYQSMNNIFNIIKIVNQDNKWKIVETIIRDVKNYPLAPFITSTLQQAAYYRYKFNPDKTMRFAQQLYEKGHITYMRTDSPSLSQEALYKIKDYIIETYGQEYSRFKQYKAKSSSAQEAHECIRPTHIDLLDDTLSDVDNDAKRLYKLIWERTIASQMSESITKNLDITLALIINDKNRYDINQYLNLPKFKGTVSKVTFLGYKIIYNEDKDDDDVIELKNDIDINYTYKPTNSKIDKIKLIEISSHESLNTSPPLYNQPSLIKSLESYGIGRPSTYANLLKKIVDYKYVETGNVAGFERSLTELKFKSYTNEITYKTKKTMIGGEKQKLLVTDIGKNVTNFLTKYFSKMLDYKFTSDMENKLDLIANNKLDYKIFLNEFYLELSKWLKKVKRQDEYC